MTLCPCTLLRKLLTMPNAALAIIAASMVSLASAYIAQHFFDIQPCILCLFQRVPYAVTLALGALAFLFRRDAGKYRVLLVLCAVAFFVNVGIAFFHTGVERHWWAGTNGCAVTPLNAPLTRESLLLQAISQCDEINFEIFGLTLANLNVLFCLGLGLFSLIAAFGQKKLAEIESKGCGPICMCKKR